MGHIIIVGLGNSMPIIRNKKDDFRLLENGLVCISHIKKMNRSSNVELNRYVQTFLGSKVTLLINDKY